jgi:simple sugar transport system substrate-binding protein
MSNRAEFIRRAGVGAAGVSLARLLGPAAALASGGGDFADHPRWRFVFVSHDTLDPLFVATQFGAQDAAALVHCSVQWTGSPRRSADETIKALRSAVSGKADGIAVSIVDARAFAPAMDAARRARIPLVGFNVGSGNGRAPFTGEDPFSSGNRAGWELGRLVRSGKVLLLVPVETPRWHGARLSGIKTGLGHAGGVSSILVRLSGDPEKQESQVESALKANPGARGAIALDRTGTVALGTVLEASGRRLHAGGFDLLPNDLALVADGRLDFAVDQQPYVQGFAPVVQLFLARISEGTVMPWDTETSVLLRRADVKRFVDTKSRFEGSSSRHEYPLRRA